MITLFILKSGARGMQYGIGTYIRELTESLLKIEGIKIFLISYHNINCKELSFTTISDRYTEINIPSPLFHMSQNNSFDKRYASSVVRLLSDFIPQNGKVVFQMNYLDDLSIANKLKEKYKYPVISIVHFTQWQQLFVGNRKKLSGLNIDQPSNNIEFTLSREKEMYRVSDHIVSVTRYMKDFLINDYSINPEKITVIPNGLDYSKYGTISKDERNSLKQRLGFGKDEIIVLFSGRIDPCKGIFYLLEAFEEACKHNHSLRLVLLGQGNIQDCLKRYKSFFGKITYTGFLPSKQVLTFYQIADIGIIPSIYDHCPYVALEMIGHNIPLIISNTEGLNEILTDNQSVYLTPVFDSEGNITFDKIELAGAILSLLGDDKLKADLITADYPYLIKTRFSAKRMSKEFSSALLRIKKVSVEV